MDSSSDDDCYINSAKTLKALKKQLIVNGSPSDQEAPAVPQDGTQPYMLEDCLISEVHLAPKTKRSSRRTRGRGPRMSRRIADREPEEPEILPQLFAKKPPVQSISLIDSDPEDMIVTMNSDDDKDAAGDDALVNYEMTIKINWQSARLERVPLRRYQEFSKVFEYFSTMVNIPQERIWLVLRNEITIKPSDTPDSLGLTIVDIIEGGIIDGSTEHRCTDKTIVDKDSINIKIQTKDQKKTLNISIKKGQKIKVLMMKCAEQLNIPEDKIKFQFDGEPVHPNETAESLDLEGGECFDMYTIP
ncbi:uncharacterized protein CG4449-like [Neodiprion virginianus]|uniref:uncharacterized protein CG4449-like n=1 Tax=Neodiprion virginianus TaxID=2961670 RepID=UPI001EE74003|nr:uncharacterized protein CG4449-like [Neodiprion virginianus]